MARSSPAAQARKPADPENSGRLEALRRYDILDTPPDGVFDNITKLVANLLDVPIAVVSLVDEGRIWFKSHYGTDATQIDLEPGLCASGILEDGPYIVEDARSDPRTLTNPLVTGEFGLRYYAGVPLRTKDGHNLGMLCAIDFVPRHTSLRDMEILKTLATVVMDEMDLRLAARQIDSLNQQLTQANESIQKATRAGRIGLWELTPEDGRFLWNQQMNDIYGIEADRVSLTLEEWLAFIHPGDIPRVRREWEVVQKEKTHFQCQYRIVQPSGQIRHICSQGEIVDQAAPGGLGAFGVNIDITDQYQVLSARLRRQFDLADSLKKTARSN